MKLKAAMGAVVCWLSSFVGLWGQIEYGGSLIDVTISATYEEEGACSSCGERTLSYAIPVVTSGEEQGGELLSIDYLSYGDFVTGDEQHFILTEGKEYSIRFDFDCMDKASIDLSAQSGYQILIDGEAVIDRLVIDGSSSCGGDDTFKIKVIKLGGLVGLAEFRYGDDIGIVDWKFGLGSFSDGSNAGYFHINQENEEGENTSYFNDNYIYPHEREALSYSFTGNKLVVVAYDSGYVSKVTLEGKIEVEIIDVSESSTVYGYDIIYRDLLAGSPAVEFARYKIRRTAGTFNGDIITTVTYDPNGTGTGGEIVYHYERFVNWEAPPTSWSGYSYGGYGPFLDGHVIRDIENTRVSKSYYPVEVFTHYILNTLYDPPIVQEEPYLVSTGQVSYMVTELDPAYSGDLEEEKEEGSFWAEYIKDTSNGNILRSSTDFDGQNYEDIYTYYSTNDKLQRVDHSDGSWEEYTYYGATSSSGEIEGRIQHKYEPFKDETAITDTGVMKTTYSYVTDTTNNVTDNLNRDFGKVSKIENHQGTTLMGKTEYSYTSKSGGSRLTFDGKEYSIITEKAYPDGGDNPLITVTKRFDNDLFTTVPTNEYDYEYSKEKLISKQSPDGSKVSMAYRRMAVTAGTGSGGELSLSRNPSASTLTGWERLELSGTIYEAAGDGPVISIWGMTVDSIILIPGVSTLRTYLRDHLYTLEESYIYMGSTEGFVLVSQTFEKGTLTGVLLEAVTTDGTNVVSVQTNEVENHRVKQSTAADGTVTHYYYDYIGRVEYVLVEGSVTGGVPHQLTYYDLTPMGKVERKEVIGIAAGTINFETFNPETYLSTYSGEKFVTTNEYDRGGRLTKTTKPCGAEMTIAYEQVTGTDEYRQTRIVEDGKERIEKNYRSGQPESLTGTGVVPRYYDLSVDSSGYLTRKQTNATSSGVPDYSKRYNWWKKDWLGRVLEEGAPTSSGEAVTSYTYYTSSSVDKQNFGKLARVDYPGITADTVYGYGYMGEYSLTGLDVDGTSGIQTGSTDRISEQRSEVVKISDDYWLVSTSKTYLDGSSTPVVTGKQEVRLTGYDTANLIAESLSYGANGIYQGKEAVYQYPSSNKVVTKSYASGISNPVEMTSYAGRPVTQTTAAGENYGTIYDVMGRVMMEEGVGSSGQVFAYQTGSTIVDKIYELREGSTQVLVKELEYDCDTNQLLEEKNYLVKSSNPLDYESTRYAYNDRGQLTKMWGDNVKPVYYRYNAYGQRDRMATFHDYTLNGGDLSNFDLTPSGSTNDPMTTKWVYDATTGLLNYSEDSEGHQTINTYRASDNRLEYVRNPRMTSDGQRTKMIYDSVTGELQKIDYNYANTTDVSYTYDRLGRVKTVTDAFGTRTFAYDDVRSGAGTGLMGLDKESLPSALKSLVIDYELSDNGLWGQLLLQNSGETTTYFEQNYDSNSLDGRLSRITSRSLHGQIGHQIDYDYWNDTSVVDEIKMSGGARVFKQSRLRDAYRKLTDRYTNEIEGGVVLARYEYGYHADDNKIETVVSSGKLFAGYGSAGVLKTTYSYNDFNELTEAATVVNPDGSPATLASRSFSMSYDDGGNRTSGFTPENDSDQYASRTHSATRWLSGEDPTTNATGYRIGSSGGYTSVTDLGSGDYFENSFTVSNSSANYTGTAWIESGSEESSEAIRVRKGTESFVYDHAGNLITDSVFDYEYDAANRLVAIVYPDYYRKEFTYDYQSRRVEEKMIDYSDNTIYRRIYIYDGNRIIAELDPDESGEAIFVKTYTWGMDIGSTLGSASGNIGGLCAIDNWVSGEQYQVGYDGSGNVSLLVNAKTGTLEAEVEYSAFGELVRTTGKWRETPFLYSTKWHLDYGPQSGLLWPLHLYDYGLRVYDPSNGRFLNRDPIGDEGGSNLYAFVGNNPVNNWDYMGLDCFDIISYSSDWWSKIDNYITCQEDQNKMELYLMYIETNGSGPTGPTRSLRSAQGGWSWGLGGGISFHRPSSQKTEYTDTTFKRTRTVGFNVTYSTMPYDSQFFYFSWDKYYNTDGDEITRAEAIGIQSFEAYREEAKSASGDSGDYDVGDLKLNLSPDDTNRMGLGAQGTQGGGTFVNFGGSLFGNILRKIPLLGRVLGGLGDVASGIGNIATGRFSRGFSQIGSGFGRVGMGALDLAGKAWASPWTALGIAWGAAGFIAEIGRYLYTGEWNYGISFGHNAIQFTGHPLMSGAITFGNTISYAADFGPESYGDYYGRYTNTGRHEEGHTYQYQLLGPLYPLFYAPRGIGGWGGRSNPLEQGADDHATGGSWFRIPIFGSGKPYP